MNKDYRLAVIIGGGTAGSHVGENGYITIDHNIEEIYRSMLAPISDYADIKYIVPYLNGRDSRCDSSNANWSHRIAILKAIGSAMANPTIMGIVVTYGTDTEELLGNVIHLGGHSAIHKPIVVCGSLFDKDKENYDFPDNLLTASIFALYSNTSGVFHVRAGPRLSEDENYGAIIFPDFGKHNARWHERAFAPERLIDIVARVYHGRIHKPGDWNIENSSELIKFQKPVYDGYVDYPDTYPLGIAGEGRAGRLLGYRRPEKLRTRRRELREYGLTNVFLGDYLTWRNLRTGNEKERQRAKNVDWPEMIKDYNIPETVLELLHNIWVSWGLGFEAWNYPHFDYRFSGKGIYIPDGLTDPDLVLLFIKQFSYITKMVILGGTGAGHVRVIDEESYLPIIEICRDAGIPMTVLSGTPGECSALKYDIARELCQKNMWFSGTRTRFSANAIAAYLFHPDNVNFAKSLSTVFEIEEGDLMHQLWCSDLVFPAGRDREIYREFHPNIETRVALLGAMPFPEAALIAAVSLSRLKYGKIPEIPNMTFPEPLKE